MARSILSPTSAVRASSVDVEHRIPHNPRRTHPKKTEPPRPRSVPRRYPFRTSLNAASRENLKCWCRGFRWLVFGIQNMATHSAQSGEPRSILNPASLAYIGDCIYEDAMLQKLRSDDFLSQEESTIFVVVITDGLHDSEIGYLYLTNVQRLEEIMEKIGFSIDTSKPPEEDRNKTGVSNEDF
ncbi:ribonuclease III family protein [Striga asiatica]|uniref:Ribonuclease III family protein n=1 Tax=Striga asiatica TaxID=4170 RepID=A0A5A7R6W1_STRAF|nr:ribonuclease III family protein [Striga asiatica]